MNETSLGADMHVCRALIMEGCNSLETRSLNQDSFKNTFGVIHLHCGSNNNPIVGQFVDSLKTSIIYGLAYTGLETEADDTELLNNLHSSLKKSRASPPNPSTSHCRETLRGDLCSSHTAEQVQR
jgi:hypothetical protein